MSGLQDVEIVRDRWRRALEREALDTIHRSDFAARGLARRLDKSQSVRLLLLPGDPESELVEFDESFWAWMKASETIDVAGAAVRLGIHHTPTAHAAALVNSYGGEESWRSYAAIHRSGAIEIALGERGAWERTDRNNNLVREFNLVTIVGYTWALFKLGTALRERVQVPAPFQLTVALQKAEGAYLGNVGQGWPEPRQFWPHQEQPRCAEPNLLWHIEIPEWPDSEAAQALAFRVGDHIEDAWSHTERRYLARVGDKEGRFDPRPLLK